MIFRELSICNRDAAHAASGTRHHGEVLVEKKIILKYLKYI